MKFIFTALAIFTIIVSMTNQAFARLAIDVSALTSAATFKCTKNLGFERAIIRGYREAYGRNPGGGIDPNFLKNYNNAKKAGYTYIEVYMFPCTGRSTCKTPRQQVNELVQLIKTHRVIVQRVWLDIEVDPNAGNWNLGQVRNRQILKEFHAVWKSTGWKFGIYSVAYGRNPGGGIDPNFLKNYNNAKKAGYTYIEVYMFPCTGRSTCKTPRQQVNELVQLIKTHRVIVQRVWLDIEVDPNAGNWNLGQVRNRQILKEFHAVWKSTGWKFGIYSNQYQWKTITGNINWILDSSLPLWYAIYDKKPVLNNYRPFGGWTRGTGKQYDGDVKFCGARLDKNVFR
ncbi:hypothetical protein Glove_310g14 [Diversispora epigaea]|uniref:Uncharacterized protein n=1 Tax=Diversispora epigaea TaxID=1348612 RepID=A0A397HV93_9GLOM|nr:hypothetical protein Glove_310g14 [Diversispora epigaea]